MIRTAALVTFIMGATTAWGQVIYAPPEPCYRNHGPIEPRVIQLLHALHWPRTNVIINVNGDRPDHVEVITQGPITIIPAGPCISPVAVGIDPITGQSLYFRKRDLFGPQLSSDPLPSALPPQPQSAQPATPLPSKPGQMIIKPWRGGGGTLVSR